MPDPVPESAVLAGIRVVELGVWVAAPGAGGLLADWGADVVKVEPPEGDPMRRLFSLVAGGDAAAANPPFDLDNRGKRSVVLDLQDKRGAAAMSKLLATADVFLTNLRPDALRRLGLDHATLLAAHPRLVYASVTAYGLEGPDRNRAGYDVGAFWARTGLARLLVPDGTDPPGIRGGFGDHITGVMAVSGILAGLLRRSTTGRGQLVATSLLRAGIYCVGWDLGIQFRFGKMAPTAPRTLAANPLLNCYRAGDNRWFWLLGMEADRHWPRLMAALGDPPALTDDRFGTARGRRHNAAEIVAALDATFASAVRAEWATRFDAHDVWWAPVHDPADVVVDPQAIAAGAFIEVADGDGGFNRAVATPVDFGEADVGPWAAPPKLGEHTAEVLAELGLA